MTTGKQVLESRVCYSVDRENREACKFFSINLHLGYPPSPCPQRLLYSILKGLMWLNYVFYVFRRGYEQSQPKTPLEKVELFYFSHFLGNPWVSN
jgi:hypothetical protein